MNDPWQFLGIAPTEDPFAIKRAYAALLKQNNPQTEPEGFQRLRAAYEAALFDARRRAAENDAGNVDTARPAAAAEDRSEDSAASPEQAAAENAAMPSEQPPHVQEFIREAQRLLDAMREILLSEKKRSKMEEWETVLRDPALDNMEVRLRLSFGFLEYTCHTVEQDPSLQLPIVWMPHEIWQRLDSVFGWTGMELELHRYYPPQWLQFFMSRLHEAYGREPVQILPATAAAKRKWSLAPGAATWIVLAVIFLLVPLLRALSK